MKPLAIFSHRTVALIAAFSALVGTLLPFSLAQAAELELFEPIATEEPAQERPERRQERQQGNSSATPAFTLVGTSRFGNKYKATLKERGGETIVVDTTPRANTAVPGHTNYRIVDIKSRQVSLRYPGSTDCIEFENRGVRCSADGQTALLSLATAEALEPRNPNDGSGQERGPREAGSNEDGNAEAAEDEPQNPFAALRAAARAQREAQQNGEESAEGQQRPNGGGRFQPRRINEEDVPPGKRLVRTPFGDRLIDI